MASQSNSTGMNSSSTSNSNRGSNHRGNNNRWRTNNNQFNKKKGSNPTKTKWKPIYVDLSVEKIEAVVADEPGLDSLSIQLEWFEREVLDYSHSSVNLVWDILEHAGGKNSVTNSTISSVTSSFVDIEDDNDADKIIPGDDNGDHPIPPVAPRSGKIDSDSDEDIYCPWWSWQPWYCDYWRHNFQSRMSSARKNCYLDYQNDKETSPYLNKNKRWSPWQSSLWQYTALCCRVSLSAQNHSH